MRIPEGTLTRTVRHNIESYEITDEIENLDELIDALVELSEKNLFTDGIRKACLDHGYCGDSSIDNDVIDFIMLNAEKNRVISKEENNGFRTNLNNWFNAAHSDDSKLDYGANESGRNNIYKLCFSLSMNIEEIERFFLKNYLYMPFNFRNLQETVYYYTLSNNKDYSFAKNDTYNNSQPSNQLFDKIIKLLNQITTTNTLFVLDNLKDSFFSQDQESADLRKNLFAIPANFLITSRMSSELYFNIEVRPPSVSDLCKVFRYWSGYKKKYSESIKNIIAYVGNHTLILLMLC